jgi:hypothetical protein
MLDMYCSLPPALSILNSKLPSIVAHVISFFELLSFMEEGGDSDALSLSPMLCGTKLVPRNEIKQVPASLLALWSEDKTNSHFPVMSMEIILLTQPLQSHRLNFLRGTGGSEPNVSLSVSNGEQQCGSRSLA